jgi:TonB family protein
MKTILLMILAFISLSVLAQDTIYYDSLSKKVINKKDASYYKVIIRYKSDTNRASEKEFDTSGKMISWHKYSDYNKGIYHGKQLEFYPDGQKASEIDFNEGRYDGVLKTWYDNGQLKRKDSFYMDLLIVGNCYTRKGNDTVYVDYMTQPSYPGGEEARQKYLVDNIIYPEKARESGIQGTVYVSFVIEKDGSLTSVEAENGAKDLEIEAVRVVKKMPNWLPGLKEGEKVRVKIRMPIAFIVVER